MKSWRSQEEQQKEEAFSPWVEREFPPEASVLETPVSRRSFIKLLGGTVAMAGLSGCVSIRKPVQKLVPYANQPEFQVPGQSVYYATTFVDGTEVAGILVESDEGRPIKVEGNPIYPGTGGKTTAIQQAALMALYDPDRIQFPTVDRRKSTWEAFGTAIHQRVASGAKVAILSEPQVSKTFFSALSQSQKNGVSLSYFQYDPVGSDSELAGTRQVMGRSVRAVPNYQKADVIVSFGADFLGISDLGVVNTQQFSARRDPSSPQKMNRLYQFESRYSITGTRADHRVRVDADRMVQTVWGVVAQLHRDAGIAIPQEVVRVANGYQVTDPKVKRVLSAIADDVQTMGRSVVFVAGSDQPVAVHGLVALLNQWVDSLAVSYYEPPFIHETGFNGESGVAITDLVQKINAGDITDLVIIGGNPVVTAPADLQFKQVLKRLKSVTHLTLLENETSRLSHWVLPRCHFLEKWDDAVRFDGVQSVVQPLIQPLVDAKSDASVVALLGRGQWQDFSAVRVALGRSATGAATDGVWKKWLHDGVLSTSSNAVTVSEGRFDWIAQASRSFPVAVSQQWVGLFIDDYSVRDGRYANNSWMQEIPDPITKLTWDNALLVSPWLAKKQGLSNEQVVSVVTENTTVNLPVWVVPGMADRTVGLVLGYGQNAGRISENAGIDVFGLRTTRTMSSVVIQSITPTGRTYELASTQNHGAMEGRDLVRKTTVGALEENPKTLQEMGEEPHSQLLWDPIAYTAPNQWGMTIDLSRCTGCNACAIACQSENNIPIVGKTEVRKGREMHWIRIDRYFVGEAADPEIAEQPVTCLQCELAPCEQVCPVAATTHSKEGLNDMTYNRCIGTRYCANACPVKVRRFNFFDYQQRDPRAVKKQRTHLFDAVKEPAKTLQMQFNPEVSVRMRGVMEKCTYCVQRLNHAKYSAKNQGQQLADPGVQTACQQACPANAIVFGNLSDPRSEVSQTRQSNRNYTILGHLNLKARTTYLGSVGNPHPMLRASKKETV